MKGMNRIKRGTGFRGLLNYQFEHDGEGHDEPGRLIGGNMSGTNARELAREFGAFRRLRPDIEKPVWHNSLRLPPDDEMPDGEWVKVVDDYMKEMGFDDDHPRAYIKHDDEKAVHITACRVSASGQVYLGRNENLKSTRVIAELEQRHGLTITPGVRLDEDGKIIMPEKRGPKKNELDRAIRLRDEALSVGPVQPHVLADVAETPRQKLQRLVDEARQGKPTALQFVERLAAAGVSVRPNVAATGKMNGFSFEIDGVPFKASQLGDSYKWARLQEDVDYDQARDLEGLRQYRAAARDRPERPAVAAGTGENGSGAEGPGGNAPGRADAGQGGSTDRAEAGRPSVEPGAASAVVGDVGRPEQGRDQPGGQGGKQGGLDAAAERPDDAGVSQSDPGSSVDVAEIVTRIDEGKSAQSVADRFSYKPSDSGSYSRVVDLAGVGSSASQKAKHAAWQAQHAALQSPQYRITFTARREGLRGWNFGKDKGPVDASGQPTERFYSAQEVAGLIPQLSRQNARGYDIYLTPIDPDCHYFLVDDMSESTLRELRRAGYQPSVVQTSSPDNIQAVIKAPKLDGEHERDLANRVAKEINKAWGDPKCTGVVHAFRMQGFANKKPGKSDFFTRAIEQGHRICSKMVSVMNEMRRDLTERLKKAEDERKRRGAAKAQAEREMLLEGRLRTLDEPSKDQRVNRFRNAMQAVLAKVEGAGWELDESKVDYATAKMLIKGGMSEATVADLLRDHGLSMANRKHSDPTLYCRLTAQKAAQELALEVVSQRERSESRQSAYENRNQGGSMSNSRPKG